MESGHVPVIPERGRLLLEKKDTAEHIFGIAKFHFEIGADKNFEWIPFTVPRAEALPHDGSRLYLSCFI